MSQDQFIALQHQIKQNQEDVSDFMRDLQNWQSGVKKKDEKLRKDTDSESDTSKDEDPPVRNRVREKKMKKKVKQLNIEVVESSETQKQDTKKPGRIKAYDYREWEKFDVAKACEEIDEDDGEGYSAGSEYETDSDAEKKEFERQRKIQEANAEKDKGNSLFKNGQFEAAITCYTRGIDADPTNAILPANRAMALIKLKRFREAEKDCSVSIRLDFTYVKAYARRGTARIELGKLEEAKRDFQQVLNIEPSNKQAISEIRRTDAKLKRIQEEKQQESEQKKLKTEEGVVRPIHKPPHLRSKKPLQRMVIEEIGQATNGATGDRKELSQDPGLIGKRADEIILKSKDRRKTPQESPSQVADSNEPTKGTVSEKRGPSRTAAIIPPEGPNQATASSNPGGAESLDTTIPPVPKTSYQLEKDWKQLQKQPLLLYEYFKQISPSSYCQILQQSLDANLLTAILRILHDVYIPSKDPVLETLQCLCNVKRFDINVMFLSKQDKKVVEEIFVHIRRNEEFDEAELDTLSKRYGLT